jgi:hypothetical protein
MNPVADDAASNVPDVFVHDTEDVVGVPVLPPPPELPVTGSGLLELTGTQSVPFQ